ncbi:MAG TPA: 4'-phosphopantetheinyl transferase superfamily protein [Gammaproteobacteria bacterium]|nr:4'-phosphopantetheinyl transferase superfamily protein [Gammaproteobacteria bacterium]
MHAGIHIMLMDGASAPAEQEVLPRLHPLEQARYGALAQPQRRRSWLAGRALMLAALGCISERVDATALRTAESGGVRYGDGALHLNLSHCRDLFGVALATVPVGLDLEWPRPRSAVDMAARVYTAEEAAGLALLSAAARQDAFYTLWTLKEAACKAAGLAVWDSLKHARFDLPAGRFTPEAPLPGGAWSCMHAGLEGGWRLALAARCGPPLEVGCRRLAPYGQWNKVMLVQPAWVYAR